MKNQKDSKKGSLSVANSNGNNELHEKVVSLDRFRTVKVEEKRRAYERVLFKNMLGVYCVAQNTLLKAVELVDVSEDGMSFQLPENSKNLQNMEVGMEIVFRLYFTTETFIPVAVKIANKRPCIEQGSRFIRFGCSVDTRLQSYDTYRFFVHFLQKYAETAQTDSGETKTVYF